MCGNGHLYFMSDLIFPFVYPLKINTGRFNSVDSGILVKRPQKSGEADVILNGPCLHLY